LLVYLTSHGTESHELVLEPPGIGIGGLDPAGLAGLLAAGGFRFKVVIISACYSGGFLDALAGPGTLAITAARHDRPSFGCADENDFTYFGRAFFAEALPQSASLEAAFESASRAIAAREADEGLTASHPQLRAGAGIFEHLAAWRSGLDARP
jgi:hypothetical protein